MTAKTINKATSESILDSTTLLNPLEFAQYAGNDKELKTLVKATNLAQFAELKYPWGKHIFQQTMALYNYAFPNKDEREPITGIDKRLRDMSKLDSSPALQKRYEDSRYHVIIAEEKEKRGDIIAFATSSTLPLEDGKVVAYGQYRAVADNKYMKRRTRPDDGLRQSGIGSVTSVFRIGLAARDAQKMGYNNGVVGIIVETEFIGQGKTESEIEFTKTRLDFQNKNGSKIMLLKMPDGTLLSPYMQPKLTEDSNPIMLHMCYRPLNYTDEDTQKTTTTDKNTAKSMIMSLMDNFDREGFKHECVEEVRQILKERFEKSVEVLLVPPSELPDIIALAKMDPLLAAQVERDYGSVETQEKKIYDAFMPGKEPESSLRS